ncbi:hypothetical protein PIB30_106970, partial [Stylosanthes scabra]|nr:hypothetical protein [Stylosanthes scabra]
MKTVRIISWNRQINNRLKIVKLAGFRTLVTHLYPRRNSVTVASSSPTASPSSPLLLRHPPLPVSGAPSSPLSSHLSSPFSGASSSPLSPVLPVS